MECQEDPAQGWKLARTGQPPTNCQRALPRVTLDLAALDQAGIAVLGKGNGEKLSQDSSERMMDERLREACVLYQLPALGSETVNPGLRDSCSIHSSGIKNMPLSLIVQASHKYETAPGT